ncbi:hypothetical protein CVT24_005710 [Panaeolus cyanescens]|uniref:Uncharacterized protein n=1 Tax=Panaeolus cyanescens TaxID=181874 RepID=A0A409VDP7_9AGAR|nr:hypothetical protein CVT24_005710 [Panaeolus cyanescens]
MRFTFAAVSLAAAVAITSAAVVPRAVMVADSGIDARYYRGHVYAREPAPIAAPANTGRVIVERVIYEREVPEPVVQRRRVHAREFRSMMN